MWVSLIFAILVLAVAFFQASQGLFSALIMAVLTICCAAASLGTYEWVATQWLAPHWKPDYAYAIALAVTFGVPMVILRLVADKLVRRACLLPSWVDRIAGGSCGLITGLTLVGVMAFAVQSIPFGGSILGFERVPRTPDEYARSNLDLSTSESGDEEEVEERDILLKPDRFAVGFVASFLSPGIFSGHRSMADDTPDIVQAMGWVNSVPAVVSRYVPAGSISVVTTETVSNVYTFTPENSRTNDPPKYDEILPQALHEFRMVRVNLHNVARDARKSHLFTLRQFRIAGHEDGGKGAFTQYHAIAIQQEDDTQTINRHIHYKKTRGRDWPVADDPFEPRNDNGSEVEVVFDLPAGFVPEYLEYKHGGRTAISFSSGAEDTEARRPAGETEGTASTEPAPADRSRRRSRRSSRDEAVPDSGRGGNVRGLTTRVGRSSFGDQLPLELKAYQKTRNVSVRRGKLTEGHLIAYVDEQEGGSDRAISKFSVPNDKRLLQLNTGRLQSRSGIGQALDYATRTLQNYFVEDSNGNQYKVIGKYAVANVDNREVVEVQYFPEQAGTIGGLGAFSKIKEQELKGDYEYVLLFLIDPGAKITSFSTGGSASRRDDLTGEDLVAPE